MRIRLLASWCALLLVGLVLLGCKGFFTSGSSTPGTTGFVYVLNSAQNAGNIGSISGYLANSSTGVLSQLLNSPFGATGNQLSTPTSMSADALGDFVYVSSAAGVVGFTISQNTSTIGQLSSVGVQATLATPVAIVVHPSALAVYAVEPGPRVEAFKITPSTGVLTAQTNSPYSLGASGTPTSVAVAALRNFLFVGMADGSILSVPINGDGTLNATAIVTTPHLSGVSTVSSLVADPTVRFLYAVDGTQNISAYTITSTSGALTAVSATPFQAGAGSSPVSVGVASVNGTPTFVFTANQGTSNVSAFVIGSNGALTALVNSPFSVLATTPVALAVDPSQNFLYVVGKGSNSVLSFVIQGNGLVAPGTSNPSTGTAPIAVVAVP